MSYKLAGNLLTLVAAADLSGKQYFQVAVDSSGEAALAGAGVGGIGSLQNKPLAGEQADIRIIGPVEKMVAGAVVALGAEMTTDANGKAITATAGDRIIGYALQAATADLDIIAVLVNPAGIKA